MRLPIKAPADRRDFTIPLPAHFTLGPGETVASGAVSPGSASLTIDSVVPAADGLLAWIEGGVAQQLYMLVCHAVTSQGRVIAWTTSIYVGSPGLDDPSPIAPIAPVT